MGDIIQKHCNYQKLISYQNSVVIFDATVKFCSLFLSQRDRTVDQMIQAARSGKQNIIEGCSAAAVSSETEIKLYGVARASFEELLEDYRDYLRTHHMTLWDRTDPRIQKFRDTITQDGINSKICETYLPPGNPELYCNTVITLIHLTNYLLDRHLKKLERLFSENGGIRERMSACFSSRGVSLCQSSRFFTSPPLRFHPLARQDRSQPSLIAEARYCESV